MLSSAGHIASRVRDHGLLAQLATRDRRRIAGKMELVSLVLDETIFVASEQSMTSFSPSPLCSHSREPAPTETSSKLI
jgi:hypothetical protein